MLAYTATQIGDAILFEQVNLHESSHWTNSLIRIGFSDQCYILNKGVKNVVNNMFFAIQKTFQCYILD